MEVINSLRKNELMNIEEDKIDMSATKVPAIYNDKQNNEHKSSYSAVTSCVSRHKKSSMHRTTNSIIGNNKKQVMNVVEAKQLYKKMTKRKTK